MKPDILTSTGDSIVSLVRNGAGIGILWKHHIDVTNENNFIQLSVNDAPSTITFSVAYYPRHISKAAQIFLAGLIDHCKS
ncbi:MAG: hypothetical protein LBH47_02075 [Christensenellaceae bacterium]|nr:hypothetical protein [Christensenellaceae bacterium]